MVIQAYARVSPHAMMIHEQSALLADRAVMGAEGFEVFAFAAS